MAARNLVKNQNVTAIAVCYLFSFLNPSHERRTRDLIKAEYPDVHVSISSEIDPTFREYERTVVTALDAYLYGAVGDYIERLRATLATMGIEAKLQVMQSRGGITSASAIARRPLALLMSGLAAGVVGSRHAAECANQSNAISLDIGGTSCDIALIHAGKPIITSQTYVDGYPLRQQLIDVNTIGAGGGSIAWIDDAGGLRVGSQSAGADPGPACYRRGGQDATVTDASVVLGYIDPNNFADGELTLDANAAYTAVERVGSRIGLDPIATAAGIHRIINSRMADEVRRVSIKRGYDPRQFALLPLGGGGAIHAGIIASELGMPRIVVPEAPGVLSAFGLLVASVEHDQAETFQRRADNAERAVFDAILDRLDDMGRRKMQQDGVPTDQTEVRTYADMRYIGQSYELTVELCRNDFDPVASAVAAFHDSHTAHYGHANRMAAVEFVNLRTVHIYALPRQRFKRSHNPTAMRAKKRPAFFSSLGGFVDTLIIDRRSLSENVWIDGPAIVEQPDTTLVVYPAQRASLQADGNILVEVEANVARVA